jgi:YfiH family protein
VRFTSREDGDLASAGHVDADELAARRGAIAPTPWTWLRQVHGARVVTVRDPGDRAGEEADAAVTDVPGVVLAVHVGDCAPVALLASDGVIGVVHAGWRGLEAGVVDAAVDAVHALGGRDVEALVGPCIHAECYEFGADDLERLAARFGPGVRGTSAAGTPALDLPATVRAALVEAGVRVREVSPTCTACDTRYYSHRARGERGRQAVVAWTAAT